MIGTRVSPRGQVAHWVVRPDGRRVTVATPRGTDTPENIAACAMAVLDAPRRSGGRR